MGSDAPPGRVPNECPNCGADNLYSANENGIECACGWTSYDDPPEQGQGEAEDWEMYDEPH